MEPRVELYKQAFSHTGGGFDFPVFRGAHRQQYGEGVGDVLRGIWRFFRPVLIKGGQTLAKTLGETLKPEANIKDVLKSAVKPTLAAMAGSTLDQAVTRLAEASAKSAPPPGPPVEATLPPPPLFPPQSGSGKRKRSRPLYKKSKGRSFKRPNSYAKPNHYNF
jgi:hypothetical protein